MQIEDLTTTSEAGALDGEKSCCHGWCWGWCHNAV